jgi:hypothetical protein
MQRSSTSCATNRPSTPCWPKSRASRSATSTWPKPPSRRRIEAPPRSRGTRGSVPVLEGASLPGIALGRLGNGFDPDQVGPLAVRHNSYYAERESKRSRSSVFRRNAQGRGFFLPFERPTRCALVSASPNSSWKTRFPKPVAVEAAPDAKAAAHKSQALHPSAGRAPHIARCGIHPGGSDNRRSCVR